MNVLRKLFELIIMKLLWGPWNLLTGIVWTITDDVAEDVTAARLFFGVLGTVLLVGGVMFMFRIAEESTTITSTAFLIFLFVAGLYALLALLLKATLSGRVKHVFSFPD
jgi:uncharacterized membrane protein